MRHANTLMSSLASPLEGQTEKWKFQSWLWKGAMCVMTQFSILFKAGPLEAVLVIFGCSSLIFFFFFFESSWKKYEKWNYFGAQWWSLGRLKNVEKRHLASSNLSFWRITTDKNGFRRMKEEGQILVFAPRLSYALSKLSDNFTPLFRLWKTTTKSLAKIKNLRQCFVAMDIMN